jgi:hypothetical protein
VPVCLLLGLLCANTPRCQNKKTFPPTPKHTNIPYHPKTPTTMPTRHTPTRQPPSNTPGSLNTPLQRPELCRRWVVSRSSISFTCAEYVAFLVYFSFQLGNKSSEQDATASFHIVFAVVVCVPVWVHFVWVVSIRVLFIYMRVCAHLKNSPPRIHCLFCVCVYMCVRVCV